MYLNVLSCIRYAPNHNARRYSRWVGKASELLCNTDGFNNLPVAVPIGSHIGDMVPRAHRTPRGEDNEIPRDADWAGILKAAGQRDFELRRHS